MNKERLAEFERTIALGPKPNNVEGGNRDYSRRDIAPNRRAPTREDNLPSINSMVQNICNASLSEVERVIGELTQVRDMLKGESDRVQREINNYEALSEAAMSSMKIIGDSLAKWRPTAQS
jgi:hypothetical protein